MYPGAHAAVRPDHPAIIMASTGERISYSELDEEANRLSHVFRDMGLQPGDHIAFCMENHPRFLAISWGAHYAGLIYTAMSVASPTRRWRTSSTTAAHRRSSPRPTRRTRPRGSARRCPNVELRLMLDGTIDGYDSYEDAIARHRPSPSTRNESPASTCSTAPGTTGMPKGIARPSRPSRSSEAGTRSGTRPTAVRLRRGLKRYLSPAPLYHAAPLRFCMAIHGMGGTDRRDGALRSRGVPPPRRASTRSRTARSCRPCSCACSSCPTRHVAVRRVVARGRHPRRGAVPESR